MTNIKNHTIKEWLLYKSLKQSGFLDKEINELMKIDTDTYHKPFEIALRNRRTFRKSMTRKGFTKEEIDSKIYEYYKRQHAHPLDFIKHECMPQDFRIKLKR